MRAPRLRSPSVEASSIPALQGCNQRQADKTATLLQATTPSNCYVWSTDLLHSSLTALNQVGKQIASPQAKPGQHGGFIPPQGAPLPPQPDTACIAAGAFIEAINGNVRAVAMPSLLASSRRDICVAPGALSTRPSRSFRFSSWSMASQIISVETGVPISVSSFRATSTAVCLPSHIFQTRADVRFRQWAL